jgi:plasmid replication initiation protein
MNALMKNRNLRQHNSITEARYEMSSLEKDIFYLLINEINQTDSPDSFYNIDIDKYLVFKNVSAEELHKAALKLICRSYHIDKPNGNIFSVTLTTAARYDEEAKRLQIKISEKLLPYLIELRDNFTEFYLETALSLRSKYSKRLYEMLSQYKDVGEFKISIDELKWRLALKDPKTDLETYPLWYTFNKVVLDTPQKEINSKSDINFTYKAIKTGRRYTSLEFKINKKLL